MGSAQALRRQRYAEVLDEHGPGLYRVVSTYARRHEDKEDLRQEFALALWRALPGFREEASLKTFAYRIATNLSINFLRRRKRRDDQTGPEVAMEDKGPTPEAAVEKAQERLRLQAAIDALPLKLRQPLVLRLEGLSYAEVGSVLGLTEKNVSVRLSRARKELRQQMEAAA